MQSDGGNPGNAHGTRRPVTSPGERKETMTKTYTINDTTYTVRTCTAVSVGETERTTALYVDYYAESGEHVEYVVFNATMPEDEDEFMDLCDYSDGWDSHYMTLATVCFDEGVNIDESVNDAAERIRNARSLNECDDAVYTICERAGMLYDLNESADETIILLKAANLLGVDVRGPWGETHEIWEDNAGNVYWFILNAGNAIRCFEGWEEQPNGTIADALRQIAEDPAAYRNWDGDCVESIRDDRLAALPNITAQDLYEEIAGNKKSKMLYDGHEVIDPDSTINWRLFADPAAIELADTIRDARDWESCKGECRQLCEMAGMADEWDNADGETFVGVLYRAADKLHVRIW